MKKYTPLYFLGALGAGGLAVSFFMYLQFLIKHETPMVTFNHIFAAFKNGSLLAKILIILAILGILVFAFLHIKLLVWNIKRYLKFKKSKEYKEIVNTSREVSLMAVPLTLAMSINVGFVLGAVLVPNLWNYVEYLFPFALIAFLIVGYYGLKIFFDYFAPMLSEGKFDFTENNSLSQMIAVFAFSMIGVGLAAPAAMSHNKIVATIALFFSLFFLSIAGLLMLIKLILGFKSMLEKGVNKDASASLWIVIPILTLFGISMFRQSHGIAHHLVHQNYTSSGFFILASIIISLQIFFGILGYMIMKKFNYFKDYVYGDKKSPGSLALICPGVAFFVFGFFFIFFGLVKNGILPKDPKIIFIALLPFIYIQYKTIQIFFILYKKLYAKENAS